MTDDIIPMQWMYWTTKCQKINKNKLVKVLIIKPNTAYFLPYPPWQPHGFFVFGFDWGLGNIQSNTNSGLCWLDAGLVSVGLDVAAAGFGLCWGLGNIQGNRDIVWFGPIGLASVGIII